jgi:hypothetical protein
MIDKFNENEETNAYAKLQGPNLLRFVKRKNVYLGREVSIAEQLCEDEIIFISSSNKISRKHVQIFWDESNSAWFAKNLSKNHIYINKRVIKNNSEPLELDPISSFQIDDVKFYFFMARENELEVINLDNSLQNPVPPAGISESNNSDSQEILKNPSI